MLRRQRSFWRRFPSFLVFQRCWQLGVHRRAPLLSFFSCFSAVPPSHTTNRLVSSLVGTISAELRMFGFLEKKETRSAELSEDEVRKKKKPDCTAIDAFSFLTLSSFLHEVSTFLLRMKIAHSPPRKFVPAKRRC